MAYSTVSTSPIIITNANVDKLSLPITYDKIFSQAVVTGYFNFSLLKPNGFYSFYLASLRNLEYDIQNSVTFAAVTNPSAAKRIGIHLPSSSAQPFDIRLHLWNETLVRSCQFGATAHAIVMLF